MKIDVHSRRWCFSEQPFHQFKDQWFSETDSGLLRVYGHECRMAETDNQRWNCENKTGDWTSDADLQQRGTVLDRRTDLDEGAHRSDECWSRNEVGKRSRYPVVTAGEVVAHLVGEQYSHDGQTEG